MICLIAKFVHRQSRSQDPQLHAHCLAINVAKRADGSYGTIDVGPLLHAKKMIGAYFRSALANELGIHARTGSADQILVPCSRRARGTLGALVESGKRD